MSKKILVPGRTGAMGVYLVPELLKLGYEVDVISLDNVISDNAKLKYITGNALDYDYMTELLKNDYDAVVDFMIYPTKDKYEKFIPLYLDNTEHYIYLSSYRVYANEEHPVKETSPRIYDVTKDEALLHSGDYCIYKAEGEEFIKTFSDKNWSIIRPAITYSKRRFQLITMEMALVMRRMLEGKKLLVPEPAMNIQATMSWAGDVAKMIARMLLNPKAYHETYSVCTSEHHTWGEIAQMYNRIGGLECYATDTDTFLDVIALGGVYARQQLIYDRYYDRIMDNSKILNLCGMKQSELMPLELGLKTEYNNFPKNFEWSQNDAYDRMDKFFEGK